MGLVYASIELMNAFDEGLAKKQVIDIDEIRKISVEMLVNSGSLYLVINEDIQSYLQLPFMLSPYWELFLWKLCMCIFILHLNS
jgi:hypothetical protein